MPEFNYETIAAKLRALVDALYSFTDTERIEVTHFIDVGEYGLALETVFDILVEESKPITMESKNAIKELALYMNLTSIDTNRLQAQ